MSMLSNLRLFFKFSLAPVVGTIGFFLFALASFWTLKVVRINGDMYNVISKGEELKSDVMPPPLYILEPYLAVLEMRESIDDPKRTGELSDYLTGKLKKAYY